MKQRRRPIAATLASIASLAAALAGTPSAQAEAPPPAAATHVALAEKYAADAFDAYRLGDHARAVALYRSALAAAPSADILYNIARVYDLGLSDRQHSIEYYERYTLDPGAAPSRLERAHQRLDELHAEERASNEHTGTDLSARELPIVVPAARDEHDGEALGPLDVAAISIGTAGLVGVAVGVGFGLSAQAQSETWKRDCEGNACSSQGGVDSAETAARQASIATLGFGIGGSLLALAAVLWLVDSTDDDAASDTGSLDVFPVASGSELGAGVGGRF